MKILLAPDKFKDALDAPGVAQAMANGLRKALPDAELIRFPLADGGEGSAEILVRHTGGSLMEVTVKDPLFRDIKTQYGLSGDRRTAFIEMARASGMQLLRPDERNCYHTTTFGTGQLIGHAIEKGVRSIVLCIGGSATNDAGTGMASALGFRFLDAGGNELEPTGKNLRYIRDIDRSKVILPLDQVRVQVACDVNNPLHGPAGAAYTYGPQKGAGSKEIEELDEGLSNFEQVVFRTSGKQVNIPGSGAAGGIGAGALAFLDAELVGGVRLIMDYSGFKTALQGMDYIITGEGRIDSQSMSGKVIGGVTDEARPHNIPVLALCGQLDLSPSEAVQLGLHYATSIIPAPCSLEHALAQTPVWIENKARHLGTLLKIPSTRH